MMKNSIRTVSYSGVRNSSMAGMRHWLRLACALIPLGLTACGDSVSTSTPSTSGLNPQNEFFVAPNGSDSNPGTLEAPFLTIQKCASTATAGETCQIREGVYRETVVPNSGITITSYNGESVTLDGSDPVTGWVQYQGSIWKATIALNSDDTNQVFVGDQMMTEARWPNGDDLFHVNWATAQSGTTPSTIVDPDIPAINWAGAKIHLWSGSDPFSNEVGTVTASTAGHLTIDVETLTCPFLCPQAGGYYYLFGILGALDQQNEWSYDTGSTTLYFWPPAGNPNQSDVRAKRRLYAFDLSGRSDVTIQGVNLFAATINMDSASTHNVLTGINARYLSHFSALPVAAGDAQGLSTLQVHVTDSGIIINGSGNSLLNSSIDFSAGNGVTLLGTNQTVENNLIQHTDYIGDYASGIVIEGAASIVHNNTLRTTGRQAIYYQSVVNEDVGYNDISGAMYLSRDGAEIYACCNQVATGSRIHHNWLHDTQSLITGAADTYPLSGIYIDWASGGFEVDQNVIWNNEPYNIFINGNDATTANNNYIHNNSLPDVSVNGAIAMSAIPNCGNARLIDNEVFVPISQGPFAPCAASDNAAGAPGATDMTPAIQVGCNLPACSAVRPPMVVGAQVAANIAIQPRSLSVVVGQTATLTVTAAGSPPIRYQWQKNAVNIAGATNATYTTPSATLADNGTQFSVVVSNAIGQSSSNPAVLNVVSNPP